MTGSELAWSVALCGPIAWLLAVVVVLWLYVVSGCIPPDCTWHALFALPFIAVGDLQNVWARKRLLKLLDGAAWMRWSRYRSS